MWGFILPFSKLCIYVSRFLNRFLYPKQHGRSLLFDFFNSEERSFYLSYLLCIKSQDLLHVCRQERKESVESPIIREVCHNDSPEWKGLQYRSPGNRFLCRKLASRRQRKREEKEWSGHWYEDFLNTVFWSYSNLCWQLILKDIKWHASIDWDSSAVIHCVQLSPNVCYCSVLHLLIVRLHLLCNLTIVK